MIDPACTIGKNTHEPCPACGYSHGELPTCRLCRRPWTPSLTESQMHAPCTRCRGAGR